MPPLLFGPGWGPWEAWVIRTSFPDGGSHLLSPSRVWKLLLPDSELGTSWEAWGPFLALDLLWSLGGPLDFFLLCTFTCHLDTVIKSGKGKVAVVGCSYCIPQRRKGAMSRTQKRAVRGDACVDAG